MLRSFLLILLISTNFAYSQSESKQADKETEQKEITTEDSEKSTISKLLDFVNQKFKKKLEELNPIGNLKPEDVKKGLSKNTEGTYIGNLFNKFPKVLDFVSEVLASKEARGGLFKIPMHPSKWTRYLIGFIGLWIFFWWVGGIISKSLEGFVKRLGFWFAWKGLHLSSVLYWFGSVFSEELAPIYKIFNKIF